MSFWAPAAVRASLVTGLCSVVAVLPATVVALKDPKPAPAPPAHDCARIDQRALSLLDAHPKLRAIYALRSGAAKSKWHLGPLATRSEVQVCGDPERLVEAEHPTIPLPEPVPRHGP